MQTWKVKRVQEMRMVLKRCRKMECERCGKEMKKFQVWDGKRLICLECFLEEYKGEIERRLGVIIGVERLPIDVRCRRCGEQMEWKSEVKANARYVYFSCPKCGAQRVHVSKV